SPYAYLAFDPGMALGQHFDVRVRWIPFQLRVKGKGERSVYSEYKVKYSYMDARRWAKPRGLWIRGPLKVYDTTPAAIGGVFADTQGRLLDFGQLGFKKFFLRGFEADQPETVATPSAGLCLCGRQAPAYLGGGGPCGLRALSGRGSRGPRVRRALLPVRGRTVLGLRPACATRTAARGGRPRNRRQGYGSLSGVGTPQAPAARAAARTWGFLVWSTQGGGGDCQISGAYGLSRA